MSNEITGRPPKGFTAWVEADWKNKCIAGIRNRSPVWCIVAYALAAEGDARVRDAMKRAGIGVPP